MPMFLFWLLIAWVLDHTQIIIEACNYGQPWNGVGAIDSVLDKTALAPMAYRPMMAWLVGLGEKLCPRLRANRVGYLYEPFKIIMMAVALGSFHKLLGLWFNPGWAVTGTLLAGALWTLTWLFDYWSLFPEWAAVCLAIYGAVAGWPTWAMILVGCVCLTAKETVAITPLLYLSAGGQPMTALAMTLAEGAVGLGLLVRAGFPKRYCGWSSRELNKMFFLKWWRGNQFAFQCPEFTALAWLFGNLIILVLGFRLLPKPLADTIWLPFLILVGNCTIGIFREIRVSVCAAIWAVPIILKWLGA